MEKNVEARVRQQQAPVRARVEKLDDIEANKTAQGQDEAQWQERAQNEARRVEKVDRFMSTFRRQIVGHRARMEGYEDDGKRWNALGQEVRLRVED